MQSSDRILAIRVVKYRRMLKLHVKILIRRQVHLTTETILSFATKNPRGLTLRVPVLQGCRNAPAYPTLSFLFVKWRRTFFVHPLTESNRDLNAFQFPIKTRLTRVLNVGNRLLKGV